jgi:peptide/nickel transport system ATP-binding protein
VDRSGTLSPPEPLLSVDISADYPGKPGVLQNVRFTIARGEIFGLIGRSGSGKSTIALAVMRLLELRGATVRGSVQFAGRDLMAASAGEMRQVRGKEIGLVMQSPMSALNPALRIETQMREAWRAHRSESWSWAKPAIRRLLSEMELPDDDAFLRRYPRQVSVGQAQRVVIAMAVMHGPKLLIADEAISSLDAGSGGEVLRLFGSLCRERNMSMLYVSHDLPSVEKLCHNVGVVDHGRLAANDRGTYATQER